jgi:hypothetical protein
MLGAFAKGVLNKDISQLKTIEKKKKRSRTRKKKGRKEGSRRKLNNHGRLL